MRAGVMINGFDIATYGAPRLLGFAEHPKGGDRWGGGGEHRVRVAETKSGISSRSGPL